MYLGDFKEDGDIFFKFSTRAFATGIPTTLAGTPVLSVYKDEGGAATEKTTAEAYFDLDVDHDSIAGWHNVRLDLSGDAFFATGADYSVVITAGTVDSVNVFGENLANFSIENRSMGQPAGATLAADIAAIKSDSGAIKTETDKLTFTVANQLDANPLSWAGGTIPAQGVTGVPEVDVTHHTAGIAPTPATTGVPDVNTVEFLDTAVVLSNGLPDINVEDWLGTLVTAATAGVPNVNTTTFLNVAVSAATASGEVNANLTEIQGGVVPTPTTTGILDVNTERWLDTLVTISSTSAKPEVDVFSVSDDSTAANNLELMYDTTGYTDDTAPASRSQVDGISGGTGGSVNIAANSDNTITDTIDNAAAVDKTGGLVGIPITGHAYAAGNEVTIASTTNYNGSFDIVSQTTNEIVITASFVSETFGGSETCNSTIQTIAFVGSVSSGTFANTQVLDNVDHVFTDTGDVIDVAYRFTIGGGRSATSVLFIGNVNGNNDEILLKAYDFVGTTWDTVGVIDGSGGSVNRNVEASLLLRHTGTGGDLGNVFIRLDSDTTTPSDLEVALLLVSAVSIGQTVGYEMGAVWLDTDDGVSGTESFVNGVADNPARTLANVITIASNIKLHRFILTPDSSVTFGETHSDEVWQGEGATLALGGRDCSGCHFMGLDVSGTATGSTEIHFDHCEIGDVTIADAHFDECDMEGVVTLSAAANYNFVSCSHSGTSAAIDFGSSVGNTTVHVHNYHGALTVKNMGQNGTDVLHFSSPDGKLTLDNTNTGGTVNLNGTFDFINNGSGLTINDDGAILETVGIITDSAAAGDPTSTDTIVQYVKQLVNVLVGTDGVVTFPTAAAPGNGVSLAEVLRATYDDTNSLDGTKIPDTLSLANINAEMVDVVATDTIAELSQGVPVTNPTIVTAIMLQYMALRNKTDVATSGTDTLEIHNDAGTRIAQKLLTDDGSDYSEAKMTSGA